MGPGTRWDGTRSLVYRIRRRPNAPRRPTPTPSAEAKARTPFDSKRQTEAANDPSCFTSSPTPRALLTTARSSLGGARCQGPCTSRSMSASVNRNRTMWLKSKSRKAARKFSRLASIVASSNRIENLPGKAFRIGGCHCRQVAGVFSRRFRKPIEASVNELVTSLRFGVSKAQRVIAALAHGDLTDEMRGRIPGPGAKMAIVQAAIRRAAL